MFRKILVANDGSAGAQAALSAAIDLALKCGGELHMICIEEIPRFAATIDEIEEEKDEAGLRFTAVIKRAKELAGQKGVSLETHLLAGHPVPSIVEFLRAGTFDLLVVGFMGHSAIYNRIIGSTTDRLVDHTPCAVLVIK
jgi:nucleotide-binding universal stress UspA family protein